VSQVLKPPEKLVVMARVSAPFGVKGWIKLTPFTAKTRNLLDYPAWWVGRAGDWRLYPVNTGHEHGTSLVANLEGCDDRDSAALLRGMQVAVARDALPRPDANEFYWVDLLGLRVANVEQQDFGVVTRVIETGANEVLVVVKDAVERLIPFIAEVIREVDLERGVIRVDWGADY
jgi:16S rRNA processing protein RimM